MWSLDLATDKLSVGAGGWGQECICAFGLLFRPCRELVSLVLFMPHAWVLFRGPREVHRVPHADLSLRVECIQRGWGGQVPSVPETLSLAQGVRSGIPNLSLWGPRDESRREDRPAAHLRSFRLLALIAGRCSPRPGLGVGGPGARSRGTGCRKLRRGRVRRHLHDATATRPVLQSICGRRAPPSRGAHVRHRRKACRDL